MDRHGASLENTVQTIQEKLNVTPLVLQLPLGEGDRFIGVIDLLRMEAIEWEDSLGFMVKRRILRNSEKIHEKAMREREILLENLSIHDDLIADLYLNGKVIPVPILEAAIKKIICTTPDKVCAIILGTALKNKGIQPLLDSVIRFLPSPEEKLPLESVLDKRLKRKNSSTEKLCAYAYKVVNDKEKGSLIYTRVYSGKITQKNTFDQCK